MEEPLPQCLSTNSVPRAFFPRVAIGCRLSLKIDRNLSPFWAGPLSVATWYDTAWIGGSLRHMDRIFIQICVCHCHLLSQRYGIAVITTHKLSNLLDILATGDVPASQHSSWLRLWPVVYFVERYYILHFNFAFNEDMHIYIVNHKNVTFYFWL